MTFLLKAVDDLSVSQIQHYLSAERLGIETTSFEVILEEDEEEVKYSRPENMGSEEDEKSSMESFVKQEIEGAGMMSKKNYDRQVTKSSVYFSVGDRTKHTSIELIWD